MEPVAAGVPSELSSTVSAGTPAASIPRRVADRGTTWLFPAHRIRGIAFIRW